MIDRITALTIEQVNLVVEQINREAKSIRAGMNLMVLPSEQPQDPEENQMWASGGKIYVYRSTGIETYSKD